MLFCQRWFATVSGTQSRLNSILLPLQQTVAVVFYS